MLKNKWMSIGVTLAAALAISACGENRASRKAPAAPSKDSSESKDGGGAPKTAVLPVVYNVKDVESILDSLKNNGAAVYTKEQLPSAAQSLFRGTQVAGSEIEFKELPSVYERIVKEIVVDGKSVLTGDAAVKASLSFIKRDAKLNMNLDKFIASFKVLVTLKLENKAVFDSAAAVAKAKEVTNVATLSVDALSKTFEAIGSLMIKTGETSALALGSAEKVFKLSVAISSVDSYGVVEATALAQVAKDSWKDTTKEADVVAALQAIVDQVQNLLGKNFSVEAALKDAVVENKPAAK